jgi:hypothetical protein
MQVERTMRGIHATDGDVSAEMPTELKMIACIKEILTEACVMDFS